MFVSIWNRSRSRAIALGIVVVFAAPAISRAELLNHFSAALSNWSGMIELNAVENSLYPHADVYYAVYDCTEANSLFGSAFPSTDTYVYAYQVVNASTSPQAITVFSVGLDPGASASGIVQRPDVNGGSGYASNHVIFATGNTSAVWNYTGTHQIPAGGKSEILLFGSPHEPEWITSTVQGTGSNYLTGSVLSPDAAPEPSTLICLAIAGLCFVLFRPVRSMFSR